MIAQRASRVASLVAGLALLAGLAACSTTPQSTTKVERHVRVEPARQSYDVGARAADVALQQVGVPYRYGGQSPSGFDCSGLVHYSYVRAGKPVPRTTGQLWADVSTVPRRDLRAGDLVFFEIDGKMQHVGMYVGNNRFVHAPSSGKTVSVASLSSPYYEKAFLRAGRPR